MARAYLAGKVAGGKHLLSLVVGIGSHASITVLQDVQLDAMVRATLPALVGLRGRVARVRCLITGQAVTGQRDGGGEDRNDEERAGLSDTSLPRGSCRLPPPRRQSRIDQCCVHSGGIHPPDMVYHS